MRRSIRVKNRPRRSRTIKKRTQRGGARLPYDWVNQALANPYYQRSEMNPREPFPIIPLTRETIDDVPLEEVAKHLKALVGPVRTIQEYMGSIEEKRNRRIGQDQKSVFEDITIPWMNTVENALRSSIPQGMNTEGMFSSKGSVTETASYPLLIWCLIASAPETTDMIPVLENA